MKATITSQLRACAEAAKGFAGGLVGRLAAVVADAMTELERTKADKPQAVSIIIPAAGWQSGSGDYPQYYDIPASGVTAKDQAKVIIAPDSLEVSRACWICGVSETLEGKVRIRALHVPTADIEAECWITQGKE